MAVKKETNEMKTISKKIGKILETEENINRRNEIKIKKDKIIELESKITELEK
jgi:polyhydroxyalkanoate synthesis regulator phasin